jgi:elongation factor Ts
VPAFTAKDVQALRQATGAGMMDAKRALTEKDGDFDAAAQWLREQGLAASAQRADRANEQGAVAVAREGGAAAVVELRCETDFVAKSPDFTALVHDLAQAVVEKGEDTLAGRQHEIDQLKVTLKENVELGRVVRFEAAEGAVLDTYLHVQNERGVNGVVVELVGGDQAVAHDVALHIASARPRYLRREDVPAAEVDKEREVLEALTRNEGKPELAIPKIVEGRLSGFFRDVCLVEQAFVKEPKRSVQDVLGSAQVTRFAQVEIGR